MIIIRAVFGDGDFWIILPHKNFVTESYGNLQ